jgi:multidrug resistance protein MdtO
MMWLIFDQLWSVPASVEMRRVFTSTLRLLASFAREPLSADIRSAIQRSSALREKIEANLDKVRSLADGVLLEFGPSRRHDLALRDRIRRWQPQLRALFIMRGASLKYRLQLPGFGLPPTAIASLQAYDECSAQTLEAIADRMEGKMSPGRIVSGESRVPLEQTLELCRVDESRSLLFGQGVTFAPLLRQIERVTTRLADEIELEIDRAE